MKFLFVFFSVFLFLWGGSGIVHAISYTDVYDAGHILMNGTLLGRDQSVSWTFDITDDGFNPADQDVKDASISLNLTDDGGLELFEFAKLNVGVNTFRWEVDSGDVSFEILSLMTLNKYGTVDAVLTATLGDFYFNSATLIAETTDLVVSQVDATPVPEPANILLLGFGLIGLSGFMKKSKYWLAPR